jgi:hypothetical protein
MPVTLLTSPTDYVATLAEIERRAGYGSSVLVSSFLSSVYFPTSAITRYYAWQRTPPVGIVDTLLERQAQRHGQIATGVRREIYEARCFIELIEEGLVHEQERSFRLTPSEIRATLGSVLDELQTYPSLEIGVTAEIVPVVFAATAPDHVLVDIRHNYSYQTLQGFLISSDESAYHGFLREFERLWASDTTITRREDVELLILKSLRQWQTGARLDTSHWPSMLRSERD